MKTLVEETLNQAELYKISYCNPVNSDFPFIFQGNYRPLLLTAFYPCSNANILREPTYNILGVWRPKKLLINDHESAETTLERAVKLDLPVFNINSKTPAAVAQHNFHWFERNPYHDLF